MAGFSNRKKEAERVILCIGEILWEVLPPVGAKARGKPMNVVLHFGRPGMQAKYTGKTGSESSGKALKEYLEEHGLDKKLLKFDKELPKSTPGALVASITESTPEFNHNEISEIIKSSQKSFEKGYFTHL